MSKFIEDRSYLKKKKKKETTTKKAAPSSTNKKQVTNIANQVVNKTATTAKRTTGTVGTSVQRQQTVRRNVQRAVEENAPHRYNNRPSGAAQPSTNHTVQDRLAASRQRREQAEADIRRRRQENEARSRRISQSRNPRMQDTARGTKLPTLEERRQRQDRLREAQRQKMGYNSMASEEAQKTANRALKNTPTVVKESAKQVGIGHGKTLADITEANKSAAIGSKIDIKSKEFQEDIEKRRKESTRVAGSSFKTLSDMQEKSEQKMQKVTKDAKGLEKAYYGALESGTGMATDRLAGPAWAVSMLSRTYGNTRGQAKKEGATENEDRAYSLLQAAKEVATEYMFQGVGLAKGLSGSRSLAPAEQIAKYATRNLTGGKADFAHASIRLLGGVGEENLEEVAGWGLDPFIKEFTYGRNVRTRKAQQMLREQSDALRSNITSMDDARAIAAYLSSEDFLEQQVRTYMDSGIGEKEARDLAENMRDYLDASLSGDTEKMADIEESMSKKLSGRNLIDIAKQDLSLSELKDTIESTTLLTATTGLPGTFSTAARGAAIKEQLGSDGIRALAKTAEDFEDGEMQLKAKAMSDRLDAGKDITSTQAYDLAVGVQEQYNKDADRQQTAYQTAQKTIKSEKLVTPYRVSRDGDIQMDEVTDKTYQSTAKSAKSSIETFIKNSDGKESLTDTEIDRGSRAIAGFKTGVFTVDDANELNYRNTAVRSAFEKETGIDLSEYVVKGKDGQIDIPATNTATKNALFAKAADNLVATAQAETANWVDNTKGEVVTQISRRMGASGTAALQTALDDVDERDRSSYMMTANASDVLYQSAKNMGTEWENAKDYAKRMFPNVAEDKLKAMYEAGLADRDMATDEARGQQIKIGEKVELKKQSDVPTGQVIVETSAPVKGSVIRTFTELARNLGVDIHLVDHFTDKNGKVLKNVNGEYIDGNIFINVNSDFEKNMGFIFMHEVTHHLKLYAPEQYKALENLVREKWFKYDSAQMQSEIAKKIEAYAKHGQKLTEEQALEEIIADAAHEFLTDRNFAREVANEDASLAQAVLTSIRNALRMLRRIMSADGLDETHMNTLFSQLDILDEAERLWLDAYKQAVRNNAAVEVDRLQNQIYEEGRQSISETSDADYMDAVNRGDMETAQRMVDEAAKEAGYVESVYHGTSEYFNVFNLGREGIHLGNKDQATQVAKSRYEIRSAETRYTWGEIKDRIAEMDTDARRSLLEYLENNDWKLGGYKGDISDDNAVKEYADKVLQNYVGTMHDPDEASVRMKTFDRKVGERILHLYAKLNNPFVIENDLLYWTPSYIADVLLMRADGETNMEKRFNIDGADMDISGSEISLDDMGRMDLQRISGGLVKGDRAWALLEEVLHWNGGYDGIKYLNKYEGDKNSYSYIALQPSDVKSADPVTYDDNGDVIPLSERFNQESADIRYSINDADIMSVEETQKRLEENFDDYKEDKESLRIAAEALSDLQDVRYSVEENTSSVSGRWSRGEQVRTIGKGITADLVNEGYVEFRGRKVKGPEDLAKLCQVLRDPRFETFRVVLTKGDRIVSLRSISSRLPGLAQAFESENISDGVDIVRDRMKRTGADGYYLIHNHPSGNVTASFADLSVTRAYLALLGQDTYKGHIILDHDKYGFIDADVPQVIRGENFPTAREESITGQQTFDLIHEPEIDHPLLGEEIHGHADIAKCGQFVNASDDVSVLIYTNSPGEVTGIQEISNKTLKNNKEITGFIRNQGVEFGAASAFLYTTDIETYQASKDLVKSGHLVDSVVAYGNNRQWSESAREVVSPRTDVEVLGQVHDDVIRRTHVFESATGATEYKYSLPETDNEGKSLTEDQRTFFRNVAPELLDENGNIKRYFHGTARADRVGYYFNPERATSGPMAYFTDNRDIATNYSRDKADTSLAYEGEDINDYHNQFVVDVDGEEVRLEDYWYQLPANKKLEYREKAGQITYDYDGEDDRVLVIDENVSTGNGGYGADPYLVRQARGNAFKMLIDAWLDSGDFFNEEERFLEVMNLLGVEGVRYKDPNYREEKVYEVYLNVTNPLVTTDLDEEFAADVEDWLDNTDLDYYARESASADMWDKNDRDPYDWLESLRDDIENGTTHVWTSIPDVITDFLREQGYDGIVDQGGKYHEAGHQVVIPFEPNQIKLTTNEHPTEDVDIRYSIAETDSEGNLLSDGQRRYFNNSLAVDEQGRMQVVYHTTNSGGFTVFDPTYSGDHRSLFFTSNRRMSESYSKGDGKTTSDIDPYNMVSSTKTITSVYDLPSFGIDMPIGQIEDRISNVVIRDSDGNEIYSGESFYDAAYNLMPYIEQKGYDDESVLQDMYIDYNDENMEAKMGAAWEIFNEAKKYEYSYSMDFANIAGTYSVYLDLESPLIIDNGHSDHWSSIKIPKEIRQEMWDYFGFMFSAANTRQYAEYAYEKGYDGVIIRNVVDYGQSGYGNEPADVYIAFSGEQVKDIRNTDPTNNPDIRYSFTDEEESKSKKDYEHATDMSYEELLMYEDMISKASESYDIESAFGKAFDGEKVSNFYSALTEEVGMVFDDEILEEGRVRMAKSKADFWSNLNTKWQERWETKGEVLDTKSVKTNVRNLIRGVMNNSDTDRQYKTELVNKTLMDMRVAYQLMKQDRTDIASALLYHSALRMITDVDFIQDDTEYQEYKGIRDYLRGEPITVGEDYWQSKAFQQFRKEHYGILKLRKGANGNIGEVYAQLENLYPHIFSETERSKNGFKDDEEDLLQYIGFVTEQNMQPFMEAYSSEYCADWAFEIADDLYEITENGEGVTSLADRYKAKYDAKAKAMKTRHAEAILRVRKQKQAAIDALKDRYNERLDKQRELAKDAIRREREKFRQQKQAEKERTKERKLHSKYFDSIVKSHKTLSDRLLTNTKDKHIPEQYKKDLAELLAAFDLQTVASKKLEIRNGLYYRQNYQSQKTIRMKALQETLANIQADSQLFYVNDSITEIIDRLLGKNAEGKTDPLKSVEGRTIDELTSSELKDIDKLLKALIHEFNNYESVRVGAKRQQAADIGTAQIDSCLEHAGKFGEGLDYQNFLGALDNIIGLDEVTPAYMFRQIDPQNNGIGMMFKELRRSFGKYVRNQNQLNEWMDEIIGEYHNKGKLWNKYGSETLEDWRRSTSAKEFQLTNGNVKLTPAQMMSIYCLSNRQQAYQHMVGAGIVVQPVSFQARIASDLKKKANYALPVILTDTDIKLITSRLTPDQIKVANKLQELMATKMAEWGNEASMSVMGIRLFEDPDYFPIKSDRAALEKDFSAEQFMDCIRNFGFTKAVQPGARNAIAIGDIFDVVAEHCNNMNLYNAYSEAMNDFMKVYNFHAMREDGSDYSVEQAIAHAYSRKATTFISTFMKDLNGNVSKERTTGIEQMMNDSLGKAKKASVFANGRVALQQPTALMRAFAVISPKYLKGVKAGKATMQEMFEHSPIALWKSWGYYDINMGKSIEDLMMNNGSWAEDKMSDIYGELDNRTWAVIWTMCKNEVEDKHKDVEKGSDEYWELVSERMDEVVDLTQVVDSPFHRSHAMRSKSTLTKMATAFMAEPTLTFNMLRDGFIRAREEYRLGNKKAAAKIAGRTLSVFALSAWATAAAAAIWDAVRGKAPGGDDDDDEQGFFDMWFNNMIENLKDNINPLNIIYYVKDVASLFQGWDQRNLGLQGWKHFADAFRQLKGEKVYSKLSWYENMLAGIGYLTGVPYKTMLNDGKAVFKMFGLSAPGFITDQLDKLDSIGSSTKDMNRGASSSTGISDPKTSSKSTAVNLWTYDNAPFRIEDGSLADNFLNHFGINLTSAEIAAAEEKKIKAEREKKVEDIKAKTAGMSGVEKDKKVWSYISSQIKKEHGDMPVSSIVEAGDYNSIYEYREMYVAAGGNTDYFDERIFDASKKAMKKSIVYNPTDAQIEAQDNIRNYLTDHGMTESELSEIAYKSYTAKELKVAFRLNDEDAIVEELTPLVRAGLSLEDFHRIYDNRNRIDLKKYKESGGKYAEKLKSMGDYNWPCNGTITSTFGHRHSPGGIGSTNHQGIDIGASMGAPVTAADGGVVVRSGWYGGYGKTVQIQHDDGTITQYSHLSWWEPKVGDVVAQGQEIGKVGSTGNSTGPHLHFGVMKNGEYVDPMDYLNKKS